MTYLHYVQHNKWLLIIFYFKKKIKSKRQNRNLKKMLKHIKTLIATNISIAKYSFLRKIVNTYDTFISPYEGLKNLLRKVKVSQSGILLCFT